MASYSSSNFIGTYTSTSKTIRILDINSNIVFTIGVCNYQKSSVSGVYLNIVLEDNSKQYTLDFSSPTESRQALLLFKQVVDTLKPNCFQSPVIGGDPTIVLPITYLQYKTLQSSNTLVPVQWYDVTDTTGLVVTTGLVIRLLAINESDLHPSGYLLTAKHQKISVNTSTNKVLYYEDPVNKIILVNSDFITQTLDSNSNNIIVQNSSVVGLTNSTYVEVENNSTLNGNNNSKVKILNGCVITVNGLTNAIIENIQQNLTSLSYSLSDVIINPTESIGKVGRQTSTNITSATFYSYNHLIEQDIIINNSATICNIVLNNEITQANGEFRIRYTGSGTDNKINVKDSAGAVLFTITDNNKKNWAIFGYNKTTNLFEFIKLESGNATVSLSGIEYALTVASDGQVNFPLPVRPQNAGNLQMFINGQKVRYGVDFTYDDSILSVIYLNTDFLVNIGDGVEFIIY